MFDHRPADSQFHAAQKWLKAHRGYSGGGSTLTNTVTTRGFLKDVLRKYNITSMIDVPCGDWVWMQKVNLEGINYTGFDISEDLIRRHQAQHQKPGVSFGVLNMVNSVPSKADLIFTRDLWFHIKSRLGAKALQNVRASGAKFFLTTTFVTANPPAPHPMKWGSGTDWGYYDVNVELPPFDLKASDVVEEIEEPYRTKWSPNAPPERRFLRLYRLRDA